MTALAKLHFLFSKICKVSEDNKLWPLENKIHIFAPPCDILYIRQLTKLL